MDNNTYELTLLINPDLTEFDVQKVTDKFKKYITTHKGEILKDYSWGKKQLAYPINKSEFGYYHTLVFSITGDNIKELTKEIQLSPEVFRHLLISLEKEGITVDQLFNPEKEETMISSSVKEKMMPNETKAKKMEPEVAPIEEKVKKPKKETKEEIDQKIDELLKKDIE